MSEERTDSDLSGEYTDAELPEDAAVPDDVPEWDDEYLDRVSDRLMYSFDLERDYRVHGERFDMYGEVRVENRKQLFHPSLNYANHEAREYLFVRRADRVTVADLEALVDLGHDLADEWIVADEEHYGTEFSFGLVVPQISEAVREFVEGFRDRTLLTFGFYGQYEVNLVVAVPDEQRLVASQNADVATAFRLWDEVPQSETGFLDRLVRSIWR